MVNWDRHWEGHLHWNFHLNVLLTHMVNLQVVGFLICIVFKSYLLMALLKVGRLFHCVVAGLAAGLIPWSALLGRHLGLRGSARLVHAGVALLLDFSPVLGHLSTCISA